MSEYQYYEFQAIDRRLTEKEIDELREYSSRADITPTSFSVEYNWGDFQGNVDAWLKRYFDGFLYLANWGTYIVKLSLPEELLDTELVGKYGIGDAASFEAVDGRVVLSFCADEEGGRDYWFDPSGELSSIINLRQDLIAGDYRALYLGWLLNAQHGELDDDEIEPPVPPGLGNLNSALGNMVDFLGIDEDLISVAAEKSLPLHMPKQRKSDVRKWVANLDSDLKDKLIAGLMMDAGLRDSPHLNKGFSRNN